jgi:hypothetical protein
MGLGADDVWYFLENEVVLNVILDTVRELKLGGQLKDVNSLACTAAVAIRYALERARPSEGGGIETSPADEVTEESASRTCKFDGTVGLSTLVPSLKDVVQVPAHNSRVSERAQVCVDKDDQVSLTSD